MHIAKMPISLGCKLPISASLLTHICFLHLSRETGSIYPFLHVGNSCLPSVQLFRTKHSRGDASLSALISSFQRRYSERPCRLYPNPNHLYLRKRNQDAQTQWLFHPSNAPPSRKSSSQRGRWRVVVSYPTGIHYDSPEIDISPSPNCKAAFYLKWPFPHTLPELSSSASSPGSVPWAPSPLGWFFQS